MRDFERIEKITSLLREVWETVPDFRLWQVISYVIEIGAPDDAPEDPFFWEDDLWEKIITHVRDLLREEDE